MKKTITITMIVIFLLNLIYIPSFTFDEKSPMSTKPQESGTVELENKEGNKKDAGITGTTYSGGQVFKTLALVLTSPVQAVNLCLNMFVDISTDSNVNNRFTIYDTVMGNYNIFNINFAELPPENESEITTIIDKIKFDVIKFYNFTRNLSIAISLFVLIYIGIRMAISTLAVDRVKYKRMLVDWVASLVLVFALHFIIIIISVVLQMGLEVVRNIATVWKVNNIEHDLYSGAISNLTAQGFNVFTAVVLIYLLTWYQVKFFIYYMGRTLEVNFLVIVSPLVTITYSIDKAGDNKAQAFGNFVKEITMKSAIQLVHAIVYVVFISTAGVIATSQPILAIFFFMGLSRAEKIVRNILGVSDSGFEKTKVPRNLPFMGGRRR